MSSPDAPDLNAVEARANAATKGLWFVRDRGIGFEVHRRFDTGRVVGSVSISEDDCMSLTDAEFIAHARTDVPDLIAALRAAETKLAAIQEAVTWSSPGRCGGEPCIRGTRVPVETIANLLDDCTDDMITGFYPTVEAWQVGLLRILNGSTGRRCGP